MRDLLRGAAEGSWQIVVPGVVFDEAVRQYPPRLRNALSEIERAVSKQRTDMLSLGLPVSTAPDIDADVLIEGYPEDLRRTLSQPGCTICDPPSETEVVGSWAATRRKPFKADGSGTADAFVWLTVLDQAEDDDVLLVTANWKDFADAENRRQLAPELIGDLQRRGVDPDRVRRVDTIHQLLVELVKPAQRALARARAILDDADQHAYLVARISLDASWTPSRWDSVSEWQLGVEVDDFTLRAFDAERVELKSAEENEDGSLTMLLTGTGGGSFEFFVEKGEMFGAADDSPVEVEDWDWNDWYVWARATLQATAEIDVRTRDDGQFETSIELLEPA